MPTECILCGKPGPLTGEHLWPDWYSQLHPERTYELESIPTATSSPTYERRDNLDLKPEVLCTDCNNRWGSTIENRRARPALLPMSEGKDHTLSVLAARRLATWATLKAMVAEYLVVEHRGRTFFERDERARLRTTAQPPDSVGRVWIGRYVGSRRDAGWIMDQQSFLPSSSPAFVIDLHVWTLAIGQVLFQVLGTHVIPVRTTKERHTLQGVLPVADGDWDSALLTIWPAPTEPTQWPPALAFDDDGFQRLVRRWHVHDPPAG